MFELVPLGVSSRGLRLVNGLVVKLLLKKWNSKITRRWALGVETLFLFLCVRQSTGCGYRAPGFSVSTGVAIE